MVFDCIELIGKIVGEPVDAVGSVLDNELKQGCRVGQAALSAFEDLTCRFGGIHGAVPRADHQPLGHDEAQLRQLVGGSTDIAQQIGENTVGAGLGAVQLLMLVSRSTWNTSVLMRSS